MTRPRRVLAAFGAWVLLAALGLAASPLPGSSDSPRVELASRFVAAGVPVSVFLPPSYGREGSRRYPAIYFLHDVRGDDRVLERRGVVDRLRAGMRDGSVPETVLVAPDCGRSWFVDSFDGRRRYASFLSGELVPWVDGSFRTIPRRSARAVAGISMGGYGALRWAFSRPDLFRAVGALSPALLQLSFGSLRETPFPARVSLSRVFGWRRERNALSQNDLYGLLLSRDAAGPALPEVLLRCGTRDEYALHEMTPYFGRYLDAFGVPNEVLLEPGAHDWDYWTEAAPGLLASLARGFPAGEFASRGAGRP